MEQAHKEIYFQIEQRRNYDILNVICQEPDKRGKCVFCVRR